MVQCGPATINSAKVDLNICAPLEEQVSTLGGGHSERRRGAASVASSSRGTRGRDPIPLTSEILHLLDRLEPDKGKQARLLTEHLTRQSIFHVTKEELQQHLERKVAMEMNRQHAASEEAAIREFKEHEANTLGHEADMAAHLAQHAMAATLAARATTEEAIATRHAEVGEIQDEGTTHMRD